MKDPNFLTSKHVFKTCLTCHCVSFHRFMVNSWKRRELEEAINRRSFLPGKAGNSLPQSARKKSNLTFTRESEYHRRSSVSPIPHPLNRVAITSREVPHYSLGN